MLTIEPFDYSLAAYEAIMVVDAAVFDEAPVPVEEWQHGDRTRNPAYPFQRDLIRRDGTIIGFGECGQRQWAFHPHKVDMRVFVDPARDAPDIRPAYLEHVLNRFRDLDLIAVTSGMLEDKPEAMRFFAEYGFEEVARDAISALDVSAFRAEAFAAVADRVRAAGIRILSLAELAGEDPEWQPRLFDLELAISRDIPTTGEKHAHTFETWQQMRLNGPAFDPAGWFVALDGAQYVGESQGNINPIAPGHFENGVTGVRREYRRRGIATALKVRLITYAQQHGVTRITTNNDARNPMFQLNLALGFQAEPAWVRVEKSLL